jgi:hypothetical protein
MGLAPEGVRTAFAKRAAGCPEPYLYDRLFSGSEIAVGVEAASAKHEVGESAYFIKYMVAQSVRDLKIYAQNNCISLILSPREGGSIWHLMPRFSTGKPSATQTARNCESNIK